MSHRLRWPSELDVNKTTARIVDTFKSGAAHAGPGGFPSASARPDNPARSPNDGSRPKATGKYGKFPAPIYPLVGLCKAAGLPIPIPEYEFHPTRKFRFDYAIPQWRIGIEVEGGIWRQGGGAHSHPSNIERDIEKYNCAAIQGWRVLRYAPEDLMNAVHDLRAL